MRHILYYGQLAGLTLTFSASLFAGPIPTGKPAHYPDWWFEHDVIPRLPEHATNPAPAWPAHYPPADDYAVANIGQLKAIATAAAVEFDAAFDAILPTPGAGATVTGLVGPWLAAPAPGVPRDDFAAINQGQLKAVAAPFYDRLRQVGYFAHPLAELAVYPWTYSTAPADDYALVNLGQVKHVFSFIRTSEPLVLDTYLADSDLDGIANGWELEHELNPLDAFDAALLNGGLTNLERYQQSLGEGADPQANSIGLIIYTP